MNDEWSQNKRREEYPESSFLFSTFLTEKITFAPTAH
jgi:hypothetical protein